MFVKLYLNIILHYGITIKINYVLESNVVKTKIYNLSLKVSITFSNSKHHQIPELFF